MEDKKITCTTCGEEFIFTVGEQEFYKQMNFDNEPKNCHACRKAKKDRNSKNNYSNSNKY